MLLTNLLFFGWAHWIDVPPAGHTGGSAIAPLELPAPPPTAMEPAETAAPGLPPPAAATLGAGAPSAAGANPVGIFPRHY